MRIYIWIFSGVGGHMYSWETPFFANITCFFVINVVHHLWSNLQMCKLFLSQKEFECTKCKATFNFFFNILLVFVMPFCFQALIKGEKVSICWFFYFLLLEAAPKTLNTSKFTKEQEIFAKWTIDGVQYQFNKYWLDRQKMGFLRNT